eukprot:680417-Rhodomonas_salina.1
MQHRWRQPHSAPDDAHADLHRDPQREADGGHGVHQARRDVGARVELPVLVGHVLDLARVLPHRALQLRRPLRQPLLGCI